MSNSLMQQDPAAFKRYMAAKYSKTPANDKGEAVAEANAHLNNHGLPNVYALVEALNALAVQYRTVDEFARMSGVYNKAVRMVEQLKDHVGGNI